MKNPPKKILRISEVSAETGLSASTIRRRVRDGDFPAPLRLSEWALGWKVSEVRAWVESRERAN